MRILAFIALFISSITVASAQGYVGVEYTDTENRITGAQSHTPAVIVGVRDGNYQYSGKASYTQAEHGNGAITTAYEARVRRNFQVAGVKPYIQGRLGEQVESAKNFTYYAVDTGIVVPVASKVDLDFSYRYRNAFDSGIDYQTNRYGVEGAYKLTPKDKVGLRYTRSYGDSETNAWRVAYTHSF